MFCHRGALKRWKYDVKMTNAQLIEISNLYITLSFFPHVPLCFYVYRKNINECQMTLCILLMKYSHIFYSLFYSNTFTTTRTKCVGFKYKCGNNIWLIFSTIEHFSQFLSAIYRVYPYCLLFVAPWRPATSMFSVNFEEDYMSLVNGICSTNLYIP